MMIHNNRRGPARGEVCYLGSERVTCIHVDGDDTGMSPATRVFAHYTPHDLGPQLSHTSIGHGPFDYVCDESGTPFAGYFRVTL